MTESRHIVPPDLRSERWADVNILEWLRDVYMVESCVDRMTGAEWQAWAAYTFPMGAMSADFRRLRAEILEEFRASRPSRLWNAGDPIYYPDRRDVP